MRYLNENLLKEAYLRLRQKEIGGKAGLERTSALMYFLAFDAVIKRTGLTPPIDLDPEISSGKNNREIFAREFARLVQLRSGVNSCQVSNLGEVDSGKSPEKRFSSNFLTVSLKKATTSEQNHEYPSRPTRPLLMLGPKATNLKWGVDRHPDWKVNLPVYLSGRRTKTPFRDLACFVLRQRGFDPLIATLRDSLSHGLKETFTNDLYDFWKMQLSLEEIYADKVTEPFQLTMPNVFGDCTWLGEGKNTDELASLSMRVNYLEGLLRVHKIPFEE